MVSKSYCSSCTVLLFLTSLLFSAVQVNAQGNPKQGNEARRPFVRVALTGKVTDKNTGNPLPGASVYFSEIKNGTMTNSRGEYRVQNLPQGRYLVEISFLGYASVVERLDLRSDVVKDYALVTSAVENEAVTITGVSSATSVRKSPVPVDILRRQDLMKSPATNLIDALSRTPGVSQISTGPAISKPVIRGLGYNRLVVIHDGLRQEGQQWGDEHGIEIDEYSVGKAEVLKGPASIVYGSDALAGVINILSNVPVQEGTIKGNIFGNYQSNNGLTGLNANLAGNLGGLNWNVYATNKSAYDYTNKYDGRVFNSKFHERDFGGYVGVNKSWGYSHILVSNFHQHVGLIEGDRDSLSGNFLKLINEGGVEKEVMAGHDDFRSRRPFLPRQLVNHFKISTDNSFRLGKGRLTANAGFQSNQRQEFGNVLEPDEKELFFKLNTVNYNVQYHFPENSTWQTTVGLNGMYQTNANLGAEALIPEYNLFDVGGFVYARKTFHKLTLSSGVRMDNRSLHSEQLWEGGNIKFHQFSRRFTNLTASAGLSYEANQHVTLKLNMARGFRAPGIPELASNGAHEGTNRYEYGEQHLKSEISMQVDGGIDVNTEHVSLSASLFYNNLHNFIYYRKLAAYGGGDSLVYANGDNNIAFRFDQNNAVLYGAECNLDIHPHPLDWLHLENTYSFVRGELSQEQDGSRNLPFMPAGRLVNQVRGNFFSKGRHIRNAYVSVELDNTFRQSHPFTGFGTETSTPGYSLLNAGIGGEIVKKGKALCSIYFAANNVTDVAYQNHLSRLKYTDENPLTGRTGVFNMGRNISVKLNVPLDFPVKQ